MKIALRDKWDNIEWMNTCIQGFQRRKRKRRKNILEEIMAKIFPNLGEETDMQIQKVLRVPNKRNPTRPNPGHIIIKLSKVKVKLTSEKQRGEIQLVLYKGASIDYADFSAETLWDIRVWHNIFKVLETSKPANQFDKAVLQN